MPRIVYCSLCSALILVLLILCSYPVETGLYTFANNHNSIQVRGSLGEGATALTYAPGICNPINLTAKGAILVNQDTGQVIYADQEHQPFHPASITKLMVLYILLENIHNGVLHWEDPVQASKKVERINEAQIYLREGEVLSLEEMIKAMVVASANDAAVALAERVAGSEAAFVEIMNAKALELGLRNSHFINASGLPASNSYNHYMSAYDIALLAKYLLEEYPEVLEFSRLTTTTIRNGSFPIANTNSLLGIFQGMDGLKTGYTDRAGWCLVATAQRNGQRMISVVLGSPSNEIRKANTTALLNYGFQHYQRVNNIYVNGIKCNYIQSPLAVDGTVLVPINILSDTMGLKVQYQKEKIFLSGWGTQVEFQVDSDKAIWSNKAIKLPQPVQKVKGTIMVPVRFISQIFGADVQWDGKKKSIHIYTEMHRTLGENRLMF
ncbi:Serine-type D-Ala-D-Ala carboxypeptidase [Desulforamulus reducens MI-1]|uniref:Serine-type D-Ala-D-Ala carboxypeptidase n=1 Tax=Desulforamulus reducens (strain ATCC BAA-1160 / DSM 100696 / MI-1) TaxID=349161 RepID=A4J3W5_DESRM|nr:stalk domain-containing protein [Desulforamulus reducens]ABO49768.1 Serine-type D-Ala-D-Ala carboxypeptidase [Desulforamulus reducens MI-1]